MAKKPGRFVWQFVIGLGFLSGLWTAIGLDPEDVLISAAGTAVDAVYPSTLVRYLFLILPTILLVISVIGAYRKGRILGLLSVLVAYAAGLMVFSAAALSLVLLGVAALIGYFSAAKRKKSII